MEKVYFEVQQELENERHAKQKPVRCSKRLRDMQNPEEILQLLETGFEEVNLKF